MASQLDLAALQAAFGNFAINYGNKFVRAIYKPAETAGLFTSRPDITGVHRETLFSSGELGQAYQSDWTPKGAFDFDPNEIMVERLKVDLELDLEVLYACYMGKLADETKTPDQYPFTDYLFDHLVARMGQDQEERIMQGVRVNPTQGTAGNNIDAYDGFATKLTAAILASKVSEVATGAIVAATAHDQIQTLIDGIPEKYRNVPMVALCSKSIERMVWNDYKNTYGQNFARINPETGESRSGAFLDNSQTQLYGLHSMEGSGRVIVTPRENLLRCYNLLGEIGRQDFTVQIDRRKLVLYTDFHEGVGPATWQMVFCNDQA